MIEVDVISGFLGAGKTTLANRLLCRYAADNERAVCIVNEVGQTSLDAELIKNAGFEAVAMPGGCICCTLKGELTLALKEVIRSFKPTKIVFETSGIFVFNEFEDILKDEFLQTHCNIKRTIIVYDSLNGKSAGLVAGSFIENQIKNASVIVVSKLERFAGDAAEIICDLKNVNPAAAVIARPWHEDGFMDDVLATGEQARPSAFGHSHARMDSVTLVMEKSLTHQAYNKLVRNIVSGEYGHIIRVKGYVQKEGLRFLLNIVMQDVVLKAAHHVGENKMTFIGSHLDKTRLAQLIKDCG